MRPGILYRDAHLAVIDKPANVPLLADRSGAANLWDALPDILGARAYLVHRLDKGTSGALLVALTPAMQRSLTRAFQQHRIRKFYLTWVVGIVDGGRTLAIDLPLRKGRKSRYRIAGARDNIHRHPRGWSLTGGAADGHDSFTRVRLLARRPGQSLLLAAPRTGRTHQLRVHLAWIGHPILGDHLYGRPMSPAQQATRLQLHCHRLVVPGVGTFTAPPPGDWLPAG